MSLAYLGHAWILFAISALAAMPLVLVVGRGGMLTLAQGAFVGVGAYGAAVASVRLGLCFPLSVAMACAAGAVVAFLASFALARLSGDAFVLASLAVVVLLEAVGNNLASLTRGPLGISGISPMPFASTTAGDLGGAILMLAFLVAGGLGIRSITKTAFGLQLSGLREGSTFIASQGYSPVALRTCAIVIGGAYAGLAGAVQAHYVQFVDPTGLTMTPGLFLLAIVLTGGADSLVGVLAGAVVFVTLPESLRALGLNATSAANIQQMLFGGLLLSVLMVRPKGLFGKVDIASVLSTQD